MDYSKPASDEVLTKTAEALTKNGFTVFVVNSGEEAKTKALELIPKKAEVLTMTSVTADAIGRGVASPRFAIRIGAPRC